jgi:hypothetical protein
MCAQYRCVLCERSRCGKGREESGGVLPARSRPESCQCPIHSRYAASLRLSHRLLPNEIVCAQHTGCCYANGQGVAKDEKKAVEYYQLAAAQKEVDALFALGTFPFVGWKYYCFAESRMFRKSLCAWFGRI